MSKFFDFFMEFQKWMRDAKYVNEVDKPDYMYGFSFYISFISTSYLL